MWATRLMRDYVKDAINVTTDTLRKDMMFRFLRSKVGFKEVEEIAEQMMKQHKSCEGKREDKYDIDKDLMKHKKKDALKTLNLTKQNLIKSNKNLSKTVRKGTVVRELFMEVVDTEINFVWNNGKEKTNSKIDWAVHKYKPEKRTN